MRGLIIAAVSLSLSLAGIAGVAVAQDKGVEGISTNADGTYVTSTAGVNPTANGGGGTIVYGDINTGPGYNVIGPPSVVNTAPPPAPVAEPVAEPVVTDTTVAAPVEPVATDPAIATETDLDADNYADALEWDLGLDPNNADTDADGVADGDELVIYGTNATVADSDGDGILDGEELFGIQSDPLVWEDHFAADTGEAVAQEAAAPVQTFETAAPVVEIAQETTEDLTATDGNAAAMGPGNASAAPGSVTRGRSNGIALLGPDGTYSVTETAPSNVTIGGNTEVLAPPAAPAAAPESTVAGCGSYGSWYDAQVSYEAAGMTNADPAIVSALDPDYDGIACEEGM